LLERGETENVVNNVTAADNHNWKTAALAALLQKYPLKLEIKVKYADNTKNKIIEEISIGC
jgi:hypothetical protein